MTANGVNGTTHRGRQIVEFEPLTLAAREFLGDDEPEVDDLHDWIVNGFVPRAAVTFLAGPPKAGKTFAAVELAVCVAGGFPLFGEFPVQQGRVLALFEEDTKRRISSRFWRLTRGHGADPRHLDLRLGAMTGFRLDDRAFVARLELELEDFRPDLVVIDALSRVHSRDENDRSDMRPITMTLQRLASQYGAAILPLHHYRKQAVGDPGSPRPGDMMRGTGDLFALARSIIGVTRSDGGRLIVQAEGNYGAVEPFAVEMDFEGQSHDGRRTITMRHVGSASGSAQVGDDARVLTFVTEMPGTKREVREGVRDGGRGIGNPRIDAALERLIARGAIQLRDQIRVDATGRRQHAQIYTVCRAVPPDGEVLA